MSLNSQISSELLTTNNVPTPEDVLRVKAFIKERSTAIEELDLELEKIDSAIEELHERRRNVASARLEHKKLSDQHSAVLSPMRSVPLDILSHIFLILLPSFDTSPWSLGPGKYWRYHPIVVVSQVCRSWRSLSLEMPILWTTIYLGQLPAPAGYYTPTGMRAQGYFQRFLSTTTGIVSMFISRAKQCPMSLFIMLRDPCGNDREVFQAGIAPLFATLKSGTWKEIHLRLYLRHHRSPLLPLLSLMPNAKATLEKASLTLCQRGQYPQLLQEVSNALDLKDIHRLTSLEIDLSGLQLLGIPFNWGQLRDLALGSTDQSREDPVDIYELTTLDAYEILRRCHSLVHCKLRLFPRSDESGLHFTSSITLPLLQSLVISGHACPKSFCSSLALPSIRNLCTLHKERGRMGSANPQDESTGSLCEWIRIHGWKLTEVTFDYASLTQSALIACLEGVPNVITLKVQVFAILSSKLLGMEAKEWTTGFADSAIFDYSVLSRLTPRLDESGERLHDTCLCTKLERLECILGPMEDECEPWVEFVAARRTLPSTAGVSWLEKVHVQFYAKVDVGTVQDMNWYLDLSGVDRSGIQFISHSTSNFSSSKGSYR